MSHVVSKSAQGEESLESFRLTDLHQPTTINLFGTPVPAWPQSIFSRTRYVGEENGDRASGEASTSADPDKVSESTVQEVLKLLEGVELSFMKRRHLGSERNKTASSRPNNSLIRLFEERRPGIFDLSYRPTHLNGPDEDGKGKKRSPDQLQELDAGTPKQSKVTFQSLPTAAAADKTPRTRSSQKRHKKTNSKVSMTGISGGSDMIVDGDAPNVEEQVSKALEELIHLCTEYNARFANDGRFDSEDHTKKTPPKEILLEVQRFSAEVLRFTPHAAVFRKLPREVVFSCIKNLVKVIRAGSEELLYISSTDKCDSSVRTLSSLEAVILVERLVARVSNSIVIPEESLELCIEVTRFHLQKNVLPFFDPRIRAAVRPNIDDEKPESLPSERNEKKNSVARTKGSKSTAPKPVEIVKDRVLASIDILGDVIPSVRIQASVSYPLIRVAIQCMTVQDIPELQSKAISLISSLYTSYADLRENILEDTFGALTPFLGVGRKCRRDVALSSETGTMECVNVMSALLLQLVQGCAILPIKSTPEDIRAAYAACISTADNFWTLCMGCIGSAKAMRMESDADFLCVMLGMVHDLLQVSCSKYWPSASTILIRLVTNLNSSRGLLSPDAVVRQLCVDIIGKILSFVHKDSAFLSASSERLEDIVSATEDESISEAAIEFVLRSLPSSGASSAQSARNFLSLRTLCEKLEKFEAGCEDPKDLLEHSSKLLEEANENLKSHEANLYENSLPPEEMCLVMKVTVHQQFLTAAPVMLSWLLEVLESKQQAPTTRAKAVKALGDVLSADNRALDYPGMIGGVERALQDDSISVREAALNLVGKHMVKDPSLASKLLRMVIKATEDQGSSVRRSAIKILRDCALVIPQEQSDRITEAYRAILNRSTDSEESVKTFVVRLFKSLWFDPVVGEDGLRVARSPAERAQSLARLATSVVDATSSNSSNTRNLIDRSHPLIVLLCDIQDDSNQSKRETTNGEEWKTASALLDLFMYSDGESLTYLHAMYALVLSNPRACIPSGDPLRFLRALSPHLKRALPLGASQAVARSNAEETLYTLGIITHILGDMEDKRAIVSDIATDITEDLVDLVNKHRFTAVVSVACECLSACSISSQTAAARLLNIAAVYLTWLKDPQSHARNLPRFLFIIGQVYRFGIRLLGQVEAYLTDNPPLAKTLTPRACMHTLSGFWSFNLDGQPALESQIRRSALESICQVMIVSPLMAMNGESKAQEIISRALSSSSPSPMKLAALNGLIELVQADAHALHRRQISDDRLQNGRSASISGQTAVASENGEGDASQSSAVLQNHWGAILDLAAEAYPHQKAEEQTVIAVRRRILFLVEIAVRDGLVGPWTTVPTLVLFAMDGMQDISARALKQLKHLSSKYSQYIDVGRILNGIKDSYLAHAKVMTKRHKDLGSHVPDCIKVSQSRLKVLYREVICTSRSKRNEFLRLCIRSFKGEIVSAKHADNGRPLSVGGEEWSKHPHSMWPWFALLISSIPFKKSEEVCLVIHEIDSLMALKISSIIAELHEYTESDMPIEHPSVRECAAKAKILCLLFRLKMYLLKGYCISSERQAVFASSTKRMSSGSTRGAEGASMDSAVHLNQKAANEVSHKLYAVFDFVTVPGAAQPEPCSLHPMSQGPSVTTPLSTLKELYNELDTANTDHGMDDFDPVSK